MKYGSLISIFILSLTVTGCGTQPPANVLSLQANKSSTSVYIVKPKDTIFSIAREHSINHLMLVRLNRIPPPFIIRAGQKLLLRTNTTHARLINNNLGMRPLVAIAQKQIIPSPTISKPNNNSQPKVLPTQKPINKPIFKPTPIVNKVSIEAKQLNWIWPIKGSIITHFSQGAAKKNGINISGSEGAAIKAVSAGKVVYSGSGLRGYGNLIIIKHGNNFLSAYAHNRTNFVKEGANIKIGQNIAEMGKTGTNKVMLHFEIRHNGTPVDPEQILPKK